MSNPNPEEKTYKAWSKEEVEKLIGWMEENQEALRGLQRKWHKDVKEEVFADDENITFNRIRDKVSNMKAAWSQAKKARDQSGWGLKPEDHSDSQQSFLEKKCAFFYRLDEIWGTRPNSTPVVLEDTTGPTQELESFGTKNLSEYEASTSATPLPWSQTPLQPFFLSLRPVFCLANLA
ncbi:hypothetical protein BGX38DRAFT_1208809 [Terfezia claveryi]|nr:hypothetical protein BGX38DRAFT_1208809 [Terfezia claveryi]